MCNQSIIIQNRKVEKLKLRQRIVCHAFVFFKTMRKFIQNNFW